MNKKTYILGISSYYGKSAAVLLEDGKIIAAVQEERFSRKKNDTRFPINAIKYCLAKAKISLEQVNLISYYKKPLFNFHSLLKNYSMFALNRFFLFINSRSFRKAEKFFLLHRLRLEFSKIGPAKKVQQKICFSEYLHSHAASAFFPSPFESAAVLCLDEIGEWATTSVWVGKGNRLIPLWQINFPHSLGLLYSSFTYYAGFKEDLDKYKLMSLAPYGKPVYVDLIKKFLINIKPDGTFQLNMNYFCYTNQFFRPNQKFFKLFGGPMRETKSEITQKEMDLAASIQVVTQDVILKLAATIRNETGESNLCLSGSIAQNCVANGWLHRENIFKNIWIQPVSGDAGGALGAAFSTWHEYLAKPRLVGKSDQMQGGYLGPKYSDEEIMSVLDKLNAYYVFYSDELLFQQLAKLLVQGYIIGWFQGRMEYGSRSLGNRSIIGDPRSLRMQSIMNLKIKYRETFQRFSSSVLADKTSQWFQNSDENPYMLFVSPVQENIRFLLNHEEELSSKDKLKIPRSKIPAVTHFDYSARIQTVNNKTNSRFYHLISEFESVSNCPILINTSFNTGGEPIVCSPYDAYQCFMRSEIDILVLENFLLEKTKQPAWNQG